MTAKAASKVVKQLAGSGTGQSLMDRVTQAKYSLAGSGLGKVVAKATTEEIGAPKKKHLDYLVNCSNEPNVSIPLLAGLLVERTQEKSWVIVFKALITTHNLMNFGNEKFSHYLASNNCPVDLPNFNDKSSAQSYEMSLFIRKYSRYVSEKITSYRAMAFDFCKVKRGREDGVLRTMPVDKLLKALPVMQSQILVLLEFEALEKDLNNAIINAAFLLLYKDLIRLFASYNEGMINLIEKYFSLKRRQCRLGLDLYHAFPGLLTKVQEFLALAESLGIGDKDSLGLQPVPPKVLQAMEQHLAILESKKGSDDEDDPADHHTTKPAPPKKPVLPVPVPPKKPAEPEQTIKPAVANSAESTVPTLVLQDAEDILTEAASSATAEPTETTNEASDAHEATHPKVVLNDEEGIPSSLQEEIIAAATSHLTDTMIKSNEAVKRSSQQNVINPSIHTQMGRSEHRTVSVSGTPSRPPLDQARSRSPSPARPPTYLGHPESGNRPVSSASESDLREPNLDSSKRDLSLLGLSQNAANQEGASPICGSPFAGDEEPAEPADHGQAAAWSDHTDAAQHGVESGSESATTGRAKAAEPAATVPAATSNSTAAPKPTSSALDDLLGLDLLGSDPLEPSSGVDVIPSIPAVPSTASNPPVQSKPATNAAALDDLLLLDPLMGNESAAPPAPNVNAPADILAGLKAPPSNVPIRPAAPANAQKNPLDSLDSTLMNLASSLGSQQQSWGTSSSK